MTTIKDFFKKVLGIKSLESRIEMLENLLLSKEARLLGYGVLKKHLRKPDDKVMFAGKELED